MKCPQCKKGKLGTGRTFGADLRVRRERYCHKCGARHWTVEVFETELDGLNRDLHDAKHQKDLEQYALERELSELKGAVRTIFEAVQEKKAKR